MSSSRHSPAPKNTKTRIDALLVERGLVPSREKAQALLLAGQVLVNDAPVTKPGTRVASDAAVRLRGELDPYVARSAHKLIGALDAFSVEVRGRVALDVGASTGGFTQVLLERGATQVIALDVGHNQLDWKIRNDPRVIVLEKTNARTLTPEILGRTVDLITVDVSFISLELIFPALIAVSNASLDLITLIKPQFEVGRERVAKGGIVRDEGHRQAAVAQVTAAAERLGLRRLGLIESPLTGTDGNQEYLAHWKLSSLLKS